MKSVLSVKINKKNKINYQRVYVHIECRLKKHSSLVHYVDTCSCMLYGDCLDKGTLIVQCHCLPSGGDQLKISYVLSWFEPRSLTQKADVHLTWLDAFSFDINVYFIIYFN